MLLLLRYLIIKHLNIKFMNTRKNLMEDIIKCLYEQKRSIHNFFHQKNDKFRDITPSQRTILFMIGKQKDLNVKNIADNLGISSSAVTQLIDGLEKNDYIVRKINPNDRRFMTLSLSEKSKAKKNEMKKQFSKAFTAIFEDLTDSELSEYLRLSKKIKQIKNNH